MTKSCVYLTAEIIATVDPQAAIIDLCRLANTVGCSVLAMFNDTEIQAWPGDDPNLILSDWYMAKSAGRKYVRQNCVLVEAVKLSAQETRVQP